MKSPWDYGRWLQASEQITNSDTIFILPKDLRAENSAPPSPRAFQINNRELVYRNNHWTIDVRLVTKWVLVIWISDYSRHYAINVTDNGTDIYWERVSVSPFPIIMYLAAINTDYLLTWIVLLKHYDSAFLCFFAGLLSEENSGRRRVKDSISSWKKYLASLDVYTFSF